MRLAEAHIKGFRNFHDAKLTFSSRSLLIGANESGKTNLLRALQLLLSRELPESALEPEVFDFHAYTETKEFSILLIFTNANLDCIVSKFREHISDEGNLYLKYSGYLQGENKRPTYKLQVGKGENHLEEVNTRFWLRVLNLRYIAGRRDLSNYIRYERKRLLQEAKDRRSEKEIEDDSSVLTNIDASLKTLTEKVSQLRYISDATSEINTELKTLSFRYEDHSVRFDATALPVEDFVETLELTSKAGEERLAYGGDGRNQQIHLALWAAANKIESNPNEPDEVVFFAIEEPEAHLHPHQQSRLAQYLSHRINGQVFITTHSPRIVKAFDPIEVTRLYLDENGASQIAGGPEAPLYQQSVIKFGHRMELINFEAFFADAIFLVEGSSEEILYKAAAKKVNVDLDRMNISIVTVDGIGFTEYASLFTRLGIPIAARTDNDIYKVPKKEEYRLAGLQQLLRLAEKIYPNDTAPMMYEELTGFKDKNTAQVFQASNPKVKGLKRWLAQHRLFVAEKDLEHDLYSEMKIALDKHYRGVKDPIKALQSKKAIEMFRFVNAHADNLNNLSGTSLVHPLTALKSLLEGETYEPHD